MSTSDDQNIAHAVAAALASSDPTEALGPLLAPGVAWRAPEHAEVHEVEARQGGVIVGLRGREAAAAALAPERYQLLRVQGGRIVEIVDFEKREDARSYLGLDA